MNKDSVRVFPSIMAADAGNLAQEAARLEKMGAEGIHIDIMDGHFVPNLTFGPQTVAAINRGTDLFLEVHLMIYNPYDYIERFIQAGADRVIFHFEATEDVADTLQYIRRCNAQAGLAFCPDTSEEMIPKYLDKCDLILLMTVHPGFGGQSFLPEMLEKVRYTSSMCREMKIPSIEIEVDGGITNKTAPLCRDAGATLLVSGNYLFHQPDMQQAIRTLKDGGI
jgi:ribulose-phosphate 3-epimerase